MQQSESHLFLVPRRWPCLGCAAGEATRPVLGAWHPGRSWFSLRGVEAPQVSAFFKLAGPDHLKESLLAESRDLCAMMCAGLGSEAMAC